MSLVSWQGRLQTHFEQLRRKRTAAAETRPLFGLEHGLNALETEQLKQEIREQIAEVPPAREHSLPWMVYACEMGYLYSGDEYWQTFEDRTPGWELNGNRHWIRQCFVRFHETFGGARPTGPWAEHFSIICWPITHAILPKDLQRQLARILYDARHALAAEHFESPGALGLLVAARGWNATSRFQQLAQEPELIGQIAAALLLPEERESDALILSKTLRRIGADLDRERRARDWLRGAQRLARQRLQLRGLAADQPSRRTALHARELDGAERADRLGIEPRVILRPASSSSWDVYVEIPDLTHLMVKFPKIQDALTNSRCVVTGSAGRPVARRGFLHGSTPVRLQDWPTPGSTLLSFESSTAELDALLSTECLLRPGPFWLFRVASDGLAYEVRGRNVRPGQRYVVLSTAPLDLEAKAPPRSVSCSGLHAVEIHLGDAVDAETSEHLHRLGVSQSRRADVWPAGLAAARWDGEGAAEWLSSEPPCIGLRADHDVDCFALCLDNDPNTWIEVAPASSGSSGRTIFVELPELSPGSHDLAVRAKARGVDAPEATGHLQIMIREPMPWKPGVGSQAAILVVAEPPNPSIEEMWEGRATIEIHGPSSRKVQCSVSLFERRSSDPFLRRTLEPLTLPTTAPAWRDYFDRQFRQDGDCQNGYDLAQSLVIRFDGEELGALTLTCEREFTPLRWIVRSSPRGYGIRLLDDVGSAAHAQVSRYDFATPDRPTPLDPQGYHQFQAPAEPGLYLAESAGHRRAVLIPPLVKSLSDLSVRPQLQSRDPSPDEVSDILRVIGRWANSRLPGHWFSRPMRRRVVLTLHHEVYALLGGAYWGRLERRFIENPQDDQALAELKRAIAKKHEAGLGASLFAKLPEFVNVSPGERASHFASTAQRYLALSQSTPTHKKVTGGVSIIRRVRSVEDAAWLCEFALRLASDPGGLVEWADDQLEPAVARLFEIPTLAKAARFLALAVMRHVPPGPVDDDQLLAGWEWE